MGFSRYAIVVATCRMVSYVLAFVCTSFSTSTSNAGIVLQPTGGAAVFSGEPSFGEDNVFLLLTLGKYSNDTSFQGKFYGQSVTSSLWIAENGNLNFNGNGSFFPLPFSNAAVSSRIAPFWDDFLFIEGKSNQIVDHSNPGSYLAITWKDAFLYNDLTGGAVPLDSMTRTTQVIWFEKDMNLNSFDFKKDDIAFGYSGFQAGIIKATIGVNKNSTEFDGIPGGDNGSISSSQSGLIPWNDNEFLLFRPTANGSSYEGSREFITAVPEPSSLFLAISSIALAFAKWRRQIFGRIAKCSTK